MTNKSLSVGIVVRTRSFEYFSTEKAQKIEARGIKYLFNRKRKKKKKPWNGKWKEKETKRKVERYIYIYIYTFGIQWGSVEKWRASLNGGRFSSFKTAELGHFVDHAFSPLPSPRSASPQSLSGRGNDNHYFFVSATAHRNGGSKVVKEVSSVCVQQNTRAMHFYRVSEISTSFIRYSVTGKYTLHPP